jgi:2-keto-3-deoxy-L-rhamnonate aldolase RhmA
MKCWLINDSKRIDLNQLISENLISNNDVCTTNHVEKVGGLNNTSKILDIAPVDAEFLIYAHPSGDLKSKLNFLSIAMGTVGIGIRFTVGLSPK